MKTEIVHIVRGLSRHFSGDTKIENIAVCRELRDAMNAGSKWVADKNEQYKAEGRNIHASYDIQNIHLQ